MANNRMRVLLSAYACEPGKGSEPGVGWNMAVHLARHHEVWVLTRTNNRTAIETELSRQPVAGLHFVYSDLPAWARFWKRGGRGVQLYYYLWQLWAVPQMRRLHRRVGFDLAHHVTFVKYWAPSALAFVPVPFVWGPVGGGESAPKAFWPACGLRGVAYELARELGRWLGEHDPLVRLTARRAALGLATTRETATRLTRLGVRQVEVQSEVALSVSELEQLQAGEASAAGTVRFLSIGRLLHWKGFHLGIQAFAAAGLKDAEYVVVGSGPERAALERLAAQLGVAQRVRFTGQLPRPEVLRLLKEAQVLVHPSLHDSGGWVAVEAMAAGRPVICLDLGGPGTQVTAQTGVKVWPGTPRQTVRDLATALRFLARMPDERKAMGRAAACRAQLNFNWDVYTQRIGETYQKLRRARYP